MSRKLVFILAGVVVVVVGFAAAFTFLPQRDDADLRQYLPLAEGQTIVETAKWCTNKCHKVAYVAAADGSDAYEPLLASMTAHGWVKSEQRQLKRDGKLVVVRPISEVAASDTDMGRAKIRAAQHQPPATVQVIVFEGLPSV